MYISVHVRLTVQGLEGCCAWQMKQVCSRDVGVNDLSPFCFALVQVHPALCGVVQILQKVYSEYSSALQTPGKCEREQSFK